MELDWLVIRMRISPGSLVSSSIAAISLVLSLTCGCDSHPPAVDASAAESVTKASSPSVAPTTPSTSDSADPKTFTTTGPLVSEQQADVAAERNGRIIIVDAHIGDHVKRGQILAQLDDRELQSACASHRARMASAEAQLREWQAEQLTAEADLRRASAMRDSKIISEENWEHAKYRVDETIDEVARFREEAAAAQADLDAANLQLEQSRIVAPFSGVIGRSTVRLAQEVKPGDVLFWVTAESPLQVLFTVPETSMAAFSSGKLLDLTTADYPDLHQQGRIVRVSPVVDPASGSIQVVAAVIRPSPLLKPGMTMQVRLAR